MKTATFLALAAAGKLAAAHATFQEILVNGKSQGTTGVRGTSDANNPILSTAADLASDMMVCKGGAKVTGSVSVAGGDKITLQWHHNNPSSGAGDADEPIAASHKGPILVYVATAESEGKGNAWVKIYEEGLSGGKWAVDNFIANAGAIDVTLPDLAAGDYLIRSEIIALHEGDRDGKAQFYNGCGQITVTSSGSLTIADGADIQAVYKTDDAGVKFNIYGGATEYPIPGPAVSAGFSGSGSTAPSSTKASTSAAAPTTSAAAPTTSAAAPTTSAAAPTTTTAAAATTTAVSSYVVTKPTTLVTSVRTTTTAKPATTTGASTGSVGRWYQCGGIGYTGATGCASGLTCKKQNDYYHQCVDATLGY